MRPARLALVGLLATSVACSVSAPEPAPPAEIVAPPPVFVASDAKSSAPASEEVPWWTRFEDPQLAALIEEALAHNRDLRAAAARVDASLARARIAGAPLSPRLAATLANRRSKQNFVGFPIPGREGSVLSTTSSNATATLSASWEPDLWGRLRHDRAAALAEAEATTADLEAARLSLSGQVARLYFALAEAAEQIRLTERTLASRRQTAEQIRSRYERGLVPSLELRLARTQEHTVAAALAGRRQAFEELQRQLEVLIGRYPAGEQSHTLRLPATPPPAPAGIPAEVLDRRPDLDAAKLRTAAAARAAGAARAARLPRLSLTATGGTLSSDVADLLDRDFSIWSLASNLLQPIFEGGRLRAGIDLADAELEQAAAAWARATLGALAEVETALASERELRARAVALERAVEEASAASRLAEERYRRGLAAYLSVLESQRQTFTVESELLAVRRELLTSRVDLLLALGGDVPAAAATPQSQPSSSPTQTVAESEDSR